MELYVLRRHFGISAHEAEFVMPAWERDLLLRQYAAEGQGEQEPDEDFSMPPRELT